ncbi:hypothetical protein LMH87_012095 [Akanthomyces muscarius]|uniref:Uncharacterized protein n=2 Tax=Akanthomyces TaxID=150366 RepID=A0A168J3Y4_CORDF|nr:hypothetical protein LMH87_012095 [Akanthomyces muscarius]KAJ4151393.1 hypothetical protein LMH87_012095 [Akanthomyces muscarius]OAA79979.1 hypothetical protein LEL_03465 [Akanthomyces lecanii RCEF 1005]
MKLALLPLAAVVSAVAPRDPPPMNSNPVQTGGETTPTQSLTILPIVSVTDVPTTTSSDKITLPILTSPFTHSTHTMPPSSPVPTSLPTNSDGSTYSSPYPTNSTSSGMFTHNSTTSSGTAPIGSGTSGSGTTGSQTTGSPTSSGTGSSSSTAAAAVATANVLAGIAAIAGLVMAA